MSNLAILGSTSGFGSSYLEYHHTQRQGKVLAFSRTHQYADKQVLFDNCLASGLQKNYELDLLNISSIDNIASTLIDEKVDSILLIAGTYPRKFPETSATIQNQLELVLSHSIFYSELIDFIYSKANGISCVYISSTSIFWKGINKGYSAAKAHAEQSMLSIAQKYIHTNNRINIARFTLLERPFVAANDEYTIDDFLARERQIPGKRCLTYAEVNPVVSFLLSPDSSCLNGNILRLDRGESLRSS